MSFGSFVFKSFYKDWDFKSITLSPYYAKSNGLAEWEVGIAKSMPKKGQRRKKDLS